MNPNLQIELRTFLTSNVISRLNKFYFENDAILIKAIDTALGTVLLGVLNKIEYKDLYQDTIEYITETEFYREVDFDKSQLLSVDDCYKMYGDVILAQLFEYKKGRICEMISNEVGIKSETAVEVFNFAVLLVFAFLSNRKMQLGELSQHLETQKRSILYSVPNGIKLILGYPSFEEMEESEIKRIPRSIFSNLFSQKLS